VSDTPDKPLDPPAEGSDAAIENQVFSEEAVLDAAEEVAETKRRIWLMRMIRRERRREKAAKGPEHPHQPWWPLVGRVGSDSKVSEIVSDPR